MSGNPVQQKNAGGGKAPAKSIPPTDSQGRKPRKRRGSNEFYGSQFRSAIKKCLREASPDGSIKITEKTLAILCQIAQNLLTDIAKTASDLAQRNSKETIGVEDVLSAFELLCTGELRKLCLKEIKAVVSKSQSKAVRAATK